MPAVTCPRCGTSQPVEGDGYSCTGCDEAWVFAACAHCDERFHMRPGTTAWTCPECGHEHGGTAMGELQPDDVDEAPPSPSASSAPGSRPTRTGGPPTRGRLAAIAAIGIVAVVAIAVGLSSLGTGDGGTSVSPTPSLGVTEALCLHLRDLQTPREDAFTRLADTLRADADAIDAGGDPDLADGVRELRRAVLDYRDALAAQGDTSDAAAALGEAYASMPC